MAVSESTTRTNIKNAVGFYEVVRVLANNSGTSGGFLGTGTNYVGPITPDSLLSRQSTLNSALAGSTFSDKSIAALESSRSIVTQFITSAQNTYRWLLRDYGEAIGAPETGSSEIFKRLYDWFIANGYCVTSRGMTYGSASAGASNVGNGVVFRVNVDENGFALENTVAEARKARCTSDANNGGAKWEETFELRGSTASKDLMTITGSGKIGTTKAISARDSANLVRNPSWSQTTPAGPSTSLTAITNWTSDVTVGTTYYDSIGGTGVNGYYRDFLGDTTPLALRIKGNVVLSQSLESNRSKFSSTTPYLVQVAWRRKGSATGTLTLRLGNQSVSVSIGSGTNDVWNVLRFTGTQCWFKNFDKAGLTVSVETTSLATSNVDVDDLIVAPLTQFDGLWYGFVGTPSTGNPTQWMLNDSFTWTDSERGTFTVGTTVYWKFLGTIQKMFCWRGFGAYLPARGRFAEMIDGTFAAAPAGAGAGNVDNGTHAYHVTYVDQNGVESLRSSAVVTATIIDKTTNGKVSLTGIVPGPTGATARKVYRTVAAGSTFKLLTTISDNVTTTYTDNTADASLGATIPFDGAAATIDEP